MTAGPLIEIEGLRVSFQGDDGRVTHAVDSVDLSVANGATLGLVGESGCGKSVTSLAIMGLLPRQSAEVSGAIRFDGFDLLDVPDATLRDLRGNRLAMIFQEPMTSLNPSFTIGDQITETILRHRGGSRRAARERTIDQLKTGKIDILVNNAGITGANKPVWETDLDDWRRVMRINLEGPFICCRAIVPTMIGQKYGRIVNIASIAGKEGNPNAAHYSASKAGLIALTKSLGKELAQHDILVNAVTPAAAKTAIFDQMTQAHIDFMLSKIPKARFVQVEELASMVAWLASEDCAFSTGAVFDISGGRATY